MFSLSYLAKIVCNLARSSGKLSIGALFASPEYFIFLSPFRRLNLHIQPLENCILSSPISNILASSNAFCCKIRSVKGDQQLLLEKSKIAKLYQVQETEQNDFERYVKFVN